MENCRDTFLLNKGLPCSGKYGKYANLSFCGLATFYALKFFISQFLDRDTTKRSSLLPPRRENLSATSPLVVEPDVANLPNANLEAGCILQPIPECECLLDENLPVANEHDIYPEVAELPIENPKHTTIAIPIKVHPCATDQLDLNLPTSSNSLASNSGDVNPNADNISEDDGFENVDLSESNVSDVNPPDTNPEDVELSDTNPWTDNLPEVHPRTTNPLNANLLTLYRSDANSALPIQPVANPVVPIRMKYPCRIDARYRSREPHLRRLFNFIPGALVQDEPTEHLAVVLNDLRTMERRNGTGNIFTSTESPRISAEPARQPRSERLENFIGPFSDDIIELPNLGDQIAINTYIEVHVNLSEIYYEEGDYTLGFYHFVLLQFSTRNPMANLDIISHFVEKETYELAKLLLIYLMNMMEDQ